MKYGLALALTLGLAGAAFADQVKLKNGRVLEGIAREEPGKVVVETGMGTITFPADQVAGIVPGRTALHEYQERVAALGTHPETAAVFETALWAQQHHLTRYVNTLLEWTIALDPDHTQARKMLGYVQYEGRWIPSQERDDLVKTRVQQSSGEAHPKAERAYSRRSHPVPEISPGYVYFGIPPLPPPRGSQSHGYGETTLSYPFSMGISLPMGSSSGSPVRSR